MNHHEKWIEISTNMSEYWFIDHIANLHNDAWWEGQGHRFDDCGKEKDEICALDGSLTFPLCIILEISDMVYSLIFKRIKLHHILSSLLRGQK